MKTQTQVDRSPQRFLEVKIEADLPPDVGTPQDYEKLLASMA